MSDETRFPTSDSLGERLFSWSREEYVGNLGNPLPVASAPMPDYAAHLDVTRLVGMEHWSIPTEGILVGARFPPFAKTPHTLTLTFLWKFDISLPDRLSSLGFPIPDCDPAFVVGESTRGRWRRTSYLANPLGLTDLTYAVSIEGSTATIIITAERPSEPEFSERVAMWKESVDWNGTMYFRDIDQIRSLVGTLYPPGDFMMRTII